MATMDGVGTTTFTGFSPALDLQSAVDADERVGEIVEDEICAAAETTPLKILITHASDLRHVLKTLAFAKRHPRRAIHFYVYEKKVEVLARHLLFLSLVFDPEELTRREQIELFVEIYGNCMLREKTEAFISSRIHKLSKLITNQEGPLSNIVDFSTIKMKVKDEIENVVRAWAPNIPFEADKQRDTRLRQYYGDRYDYRPNVADWDYHMKLVGLTTIIHEKQYKYWRRTGQAFVIDDTAYPKPNRTLASETEGRLKGSSVVMRGFWCDIVNSPYLSFGISSENKSLFEKKGEQHTKTSVDVTEHNLSTYLKEILDISPEDRPEFKIFFGLGEPDALCGKSAYKNIFSIVYLSNMAVHYIKPALLTLLKPKARIVCETARFVLHSLINLETTKTLNGVSGI
eukprot:TRINITY_DN4408_c0_g1_i1.p1 TRINITY_DN4408_c0_g1~~TRINITY_DN4408_c0_g1_i1.p1  ORF type:complete len:401 (+),score=67.50 TRINITY_DN4408_c0_g1_i1:81-1283(+)